MCLDPVTVTLASFVASSGLQAVSQYQAGAAASRAGRLQQYSYETEAVRIGTDTSAAVRRRWQEAQDAEARNNLAIALSGLDPSSFDAIRAGSRERVAEDMRAIVASGAARAGDVRASGAAARAEGLNRKGAATAGAFGTVLSAVSTYEFNRTPDLPSLFTPFGDR